ncbi:hypothetical protein D3C78_1818310 [compost metagenome]
MLREIMAHGLLRMEMDKRTMVNGNHYDMTRIRDLLLENKFITKGTKYLYINLERQMYASRYYLRIRNGNRNIIELLIYPDDKENIFSDKEVAHEALHA